MKKGYVIYNAVGQTLNQRLYWVSFTGKHWSGNEIIHPIEAMYAIEAALRNAEIKPVLKMKAYESPEGNAVLTGEAESFFKVQDKE